MGLFRAAAPKSKKSNEVKPLVDQKKQRKVPPVWKGAVGGVYALNNAANLQAKFTIGKADDPFEREADVVAENVMAGRQVQSITPVPAGGLGSVAKMPEDEEGENEEAEEAGSEAGQTQLLQRNEETTEVDLVDERDSSQTKLIQAEFEEVEFGESGAQPLLIQREPETEDTNIEAEEQQQEAEASQTMLLQRKCAECEAEETEAGDQQTQLIQREKGEVTEAEEGSQETGEEQQTKLLQKKENKDQDDQEDGEAGQTKLVQREPSEEPEEEQQIKRLQKKEDEPESTEDAEEQAQEGQPKLIQRENEEQRNREPEGELVQSKLIQAKCVECEAEEAGTGNDEETGAEPQTKEEEGREHNSEEEQPKLIQTKVAFPPVPDAEKKQQGEEANKKKEDEDKEGQEAEEDKGEGEEAEGIDPEIEAYEPAEISEPPLPVQAKANTPSGKRQSSLKNNMPSSSGNPLDDNTRSDMEHHFGRDLSNVRIHTDNSSQVMNRDIGAKAFTRGSNIYFNSGQYQPDTDSGKRLLAHELTHTVQQGAVSNTVQRFPREEQTVTLDEKPKKPNDGGEVKGKMDAKIKDEQEDGSDLSEDEKKEKQKPDRGKVKKDSNKLERSGQSKPAIDRGAIAKQKTEEQKSQLDQKVGQDSETAKDEEGDKKKEQGELSDAEAAAQRAEEAKAKAAAVPIPEKPQAFRHPRMDAPVDSIGEALPRQPNMDMRVRGLGYIGEMLREKGYEMKRAAAEQTVGAFGQDAVLEKLREDLANSMEGTALMHTHLDERKTIVEDAKTAHLESVDRQQFVAEKAPEIKAKAEGGRSDASSLAADSKAKADKAQSEIPDDDDAKEDAEKQAGDMKDSSDGAAKMDDASSGAVKRAGQYIKDAAKAEEDNKKSETNIADTENKIKETDTRLSEMDATNEQSNEKIEKAGPGPELIRENAKQTAQSGDQLIAATIVMELELNALQEQYLATAKAMESKEEAKERIKKEQENKAADPKLSERQKRLIEFGNASDAKQDKMLDEMSDEELAELKEDAENTPTEEEIEKKEAEAAIAAGKKEGANADPRAPQIAAMDGQRKQRVDGVLDIADKNMNFLTAAQQRMVANRVVAESVKDDIKNINVLQMVKGMVEGMINPMASIDSAVQGFKKIGSGIKNLFSADAWSKDPLGNLLSVAANISTGLAMVFSSILGIASIIVALMVVLTIVSWGTLSWMTGPVIGWMGTVMTYAGWGAIIAGSLAVYFNYLSYLKNMNDAGTAKTARELFGSADEMKKNTTDGFQGAMAVVEGVGAVKMGPKLSSGQHFKSIPRTPKEAMSRLGKGVKGGAVALASMPGRAVRGVASLIRGGKKGLLKIKKKIMNFARKGDAPPTRADIPKDVKIKTPKDKSLGSFDGKKVKGEVDLPNGERMRILDDGRCVVCASPCRYVGFNYAKELTANPKMAMRLERIEKSLAKNPNQPRVIQAHRDIQLQLKKARIEKPTKIKTDFADELASNPALAKQLADLEPRIKAKPTNKKLQRRIDSIERKLKQQRKTVAEVTGGKAKAKALGYPDKPPAGYEWYTGKNGQPKVRRTKGNPNGPRREFDPEVPATKKDGTPTPLDERFPIRPKKTSKRLQYLGGTPGKGSATGQKVLNRMRREPVPGKPGRKKIEVMGTPKRDHVHTKGPNANPPPKWKEDYFPIDDMDMGHKHDAVKYWNETGRKLGPKHPEVRKWMLDPDKYELEHKSFNRSKGSIAGHEGHTYLPPETD